jgi:HlyD family secretion protein
MQDSNNKEKINMQDLQKLLMSSGAGHNTKDGNSQDPNKSKIQLLKEKIIAFIKKSIGITQGAMYKSVHYIDRFINFIVKNNDPERNEILQYARPPILFGTFIIIIFVFLGGIWATTAPLDSAAHAMGTVMASSDKQIIQYSGGGVGIIKTIFVKQGDFVKAGDPIIELDETQAKTNYEIVLNHYLNALALESRLLAERDDLPKIEFNELLYQQNSSEINKLIHVQTNIFNSKKENLEKNITSTFKEIEQHKKRIEAYEARKKSYIKTLNIINSKLTNTYNLIKEGFSSNSEAQKLEMQEAELRSNISSTESEIANAEQDIAKAEIKIIAIKNQFLSDTLKELKETQAQKAELRERFVTAKDNLDRIILRSPVDGIVNEVKYHTIGGVIGNGNPVAEVTPTNDRLIVDARIPVVNIDSVMVGQKAKLKFLAFKSRTSPMFLGTVVSISPDTINDQQAAMSFAQHNKAMAKAGQSFYVAKIELDMEEFEKVAKPRGLKLIPGMTADIQIVTGTRTLFRYLVDPVVDQAFKAFKER